MYNLVANTVTRYQRVIPQIRLLHPVITMSKDLMISPPMPEESGVSKYSRTFGYPVENWKNPFLNVAPVSGLVL